jgi:glutaminase
MVLSPDLVQKAVTDAHSKFAATKGGANASYIPYLASVPANLFGAAVVTAEGLVYEAGDTRYGFAIE